MKTFNIKSGIAVVVVALLSRVVTIGASETDDKPKMSSSIKKMLLSDPTKLFADEFDIRSLTPDERKMRAVSRYLRDGKALQSLTLKNLTIPDDKKNKINAVFEEQFDYVVSTKARPRTLAGRPRDFMAEPGSKNAPVPAHAKAPGGIPAKEINRPSTSPFDDQRPLINRIAVELPTDQIDPYMALAERWRLLRADGIADGPIRQVARAILDPKLKLEKEVETECRNLLMQKMRELGPDRRYVQKRVQAAEEGKALVLAKLNETQRIQYEATLAELRHAYADEVVELIEFRAERDKPAVMTGVPVKKKD